MSREAFDVEAALERCHKGTAWQRDLIRAQLIDARAAALEEAEYLCRQMFNRAATADECADAIRALKEQG